MGKVLRTDYCPSVCYQDQFKENIMKSPRSLLPNVNARPVFTIGMVTHGSYPGSHPNAIEMMQWVPVEKKSRFHIRKILLTTKTKILWQLLLRYTLLSA